MSAASRNVLGTLTQDYLWIRSLLDEPPSKLTESLGKSSEAFQKAKQGNDSAGWSTAVKSLTSVVTEQEGRGCVTDAKTTVFSTNIQS